MSGDSSAAGLDPVSGLGSAGLVVVASGGLPRHQHYLVDWTWSRARPSQHTAGDTGTLGRRGRGGGGGRGLANIFALNF